MMIEQMDEIIEETMLGCWPEIGEGGKHAWDSTFRRDIVYPAVRRFRQSDAREAAKRLGRQRKTAPTAQQWADEATKVAASSGRATDKPVRVECEDCQGSGLISFTAVLDTDADERRYLPSTIRHYLEPHYSGASDRAIACHCPNAPKSAAKVDQELRRLVMDRNTAFEEANALRGHAGPVSAESLAQVKVKLEASGAFRRVSDTGARTAPADDPDNPPF